MCIQNKIKAAGLKVTPQRKLIYEIMQELGHSSIDELIARVKMRNADMTVSTVYRIVDSFYQVGLLSKFIDPSGKTIFDIRVGEHHHIFTAEDTIKDLEDDQLTEMIRQRLTAKIPVNEEIDRISIHIITKLNTNQDGKEKTDIGKRPPYSG